MPKEFIHRSHFEFPAETVFDWHERPLAFVRLTPPWEPVELVSMSDGIRDGSRVELRMKTPIGFHQKWIAEHRGYEHGRRFQDVQVSGPFASWEHTHSFEPDGASACSLEDRIIYQLPFRPFGNLGAGFIRGKLDSMFAYRHTTTRNDLIAHQQYANQSPKRILITGATGLVGQQVRAFLTTGGHEVHYLTRTKRDDPQATHWNPSEGQLDSEQLENFEIVFHLAGENIAEGRWTPKKKHAIIDSRVDGTNLLAKTLAKLNSPPEVLVCASATGFYGDRGNEPVTEDSPPGEGFLAETCQKWEAAADPAREAGIRTVHARIGMVLTPAGGALAKMLPIFNWGGGGVVGNGRQYWSWIAIDDLIYGLHRLAFDASLSGPVNLSAPETTTNREFTKAMGEVLSRPTLVPAPGFGLKMVFGKMAEEVLLAGAKVIPQRLEQANFPFRYPTLREALRHVLGK